MFQDSIQHDHQILSGLLIQNPELLHLFLAQTWKERVLYIALKVDSRPEGGTEGL